MLTTPAERNHIKVFIASTVYDFESQLESIYDLLDNYGYDVHVSQQGTLLLNSRLSNLDNCLFNVENCDVFVGFIRPDYGSGVLKRGDKSITHQEFETAYKRDIPRFVLGDYRVSFTRNLFRNNSVIIDSQFRRFDFSRISFENSRVMDTRCVEMYNQAIQDNERDASLRTGNWVQEYITLKDILLHLDTQFKYVDNIRKLIYH